MRGTLITIRTKTWLYAKTLPRTKTRLLAKTRLLEMTRASWNGRVGNLGTGADFLCCTDVHFLCCTDVHFLCTTSVCKKGFDYLSATGMTGGFMQTVLKGAEDRYFTTDPDVRLWRGVFRRVGSFAVQAIPLPWASDPEFGRVCSLRVETLGDLLCGVIVQVTVRRQRDDTYFPIEALLKQVSLVIDDAVVDTHTSDWMHVYNTLHCTYDASEKYKRLVNFGAEHEETFMVPLSFSFCRSPACALPLVALRNSEIKVQFTLADAEDVGLDPACLSVRVYGEYAYVDQDERRELMTSPYDLLLEQVQVKTFTLPDTIPATDKMAPFTAKFNLARPIKSLYFFFRHDSDKYHGKYVGGTVPLALRPDSSCPSGLCPVHRCCDSQAPVHEAQLFFDGVPRTPMMRFVYFNRLLARQCIGQPVPGVGVVPFGMDLEEVAPWGTCNMSAVREVRLDIVMKKHATLDEGSTDSSARDIGDLRSLHVLAWGYNFLRVENGRAKMMFS